MMISDCQRRLTAAYADLKAVLENEKDLSESEEYQNASKALELALPHFWYMIYNLWTKIVPRQV